MRKLKLIDGKYVYDRTGSLVLLICDGLCPQEIDKMKYENGKIYEDSLESFYKLIDTTHIFHSIESDAWTVWRASPFKLSLLSF